MGIAEDPATPRPDRFPPLAIPSPGSTEPSGRRGSVRPAAVGLLYVTVGLLWLLAATPLLAAWLHGNDMTATLFGQWPGALAIIAGCSGKRLARRGARQVLQDERQAAGGLALNHVLSHVQKLGDFLLRKSANAA